jgi:hypothetical protein
MFIETAKFGEPQSTYLLPKNIDKVKINQSPAVIVLMQKEEGQLNRLETIFPDGQIIKENEIDIYKINF